MNTRRGWDGGLTISVLGQSWRFFRHIGSAAIFCALAVCYRPAQASSTQVIYSFAGDEDGEYCDTDVDIDSAGNLYGTTVIGGDFGSGTVWQLTPVAGSWIHNVLYDFTGSSDGGEPYKGVTVAADGSLYGTAVTGGSGSCEGGCGVVYRLTKSGSTWTQTVIHAFTGGDDGSGPGSRVALDNRGTVYGTTPTGGAFGFGAIYLLRQTTNGSWKLRVIHSFTGGEDGSGGSAGRMIFRNGHLFGNATTGGSFGHGTVYALKPTASGEWTFQTLYSFQGQPDGSFPYGAILFDGANNIFGTTYYGGTNGLGSVYQLTRGAGSVWTEKVIYSFKPGSDGNSSISNLVSDTTGNLYGTTSEGGLGSGAIFKLSSQSGGWLESLPHSFAGPPDGAFPYAGMVNGGSNVFYGATTHGGDDDEGAVYQFSP